MVRNEYAKNRKGFSLYYILFIFYSENDIKTVICCFISVAIACRKSPIFPYPDIFDHLALHKRYFSFKITLY